jgi:SpoIID/LytB domain protein
MCQWGAKGMAEQGYTATQILAYYYSGSTLSTLPDP